MEHVTIDIMEKKFIDYTNELLSNIAYECAESKCHGNILYYAIRDYKNDIVEYLLNSGAELYLYYTSYHPLFIAAIFNNVPAAELLLRHGATPDYTRLLHCACNMQHYAFAKWCLERGADANANHGAHSMLYYSLDTDHRDYPLNNCDYDIVEEIRDEHIGEDDYEDDEAERHGDHCVAYLLLLHGATLDDDVCDNYDDDTVEQLERLEQRARTQRATAFLCAKLPPSL